jgi:type II secretory pathway pseudopilin PulG
VLRQKAHGFALIDLIFVCGVIGVLSSVALPRFLLAKQSASAASAIASMRTITSAQLTYALTCGNGFYAPNLSTLGTAPLGTNESFIAAGLGDANIVTKSNYTIQVAASPYPGSPSSCNGLAGGLAGQGYVAAADPLEASNLRFFGTNANNVIYELDSSLLAVMPEVGIPPSGQVITR